MKFKIETNEELKISILETLEKNKISGVDIDINTNNEKGSFGPSFGIPELTIIASSVYVAIEVFKRIYFIIKNKDLTSVKITFPDGKEVIIKKEMTLEDIESLVK